MIALLKCIQVREYVFLAIIAKSITVKFKSKRTSTVPDECYKNPTSYKTFDLLYNLVNHVRFGRQLDSTDNITEITINLHEHVRCSDIPNNTLVLYPQPISITKYTTRFYIDDTFTTYRYVIQDPHYENMNTQLVFSNFFDFPRNTFICGFLIMNTDLDNHEDPSLWTCGSKQLATIHDRLISLKKIGRIPKTIDISSFTDVTLKQSNNNT